MPGMSFICDDSNDLDKIESKILNSFKSISQSEQYKNEILLKRDNFILSCSKYTGYPTTTFENDKYFIYIEGKIYDKQYSVLEKELNAHCRYYFF